MRVSIYDYWVALCCQTSGKLHHKVSSYLQLSFFLFLAYPFYPMLPYTTRSVSWCSFLPLYFHNLLFLLWLFQIILSMISFLCAASLYIIFFINWSLIVSSSILLKYFECLSRVERLSVPLLVLLLNCTTVNLLLY